MTNLTAVKQNSSLTINSIDELRTISGMLSKSGYFQDAKDAAQCGVKILAGIEMGFGAFASMTGIHIIKGKPSAGANLMAAAIKKHPNYNYRVIEMTESVCKVQFYESGEECGVSEFTIEDAKKAGTQNLQKFARNMLFARAISNGVRWYCPDIFSAPVYTPEELGAHVDGDGNYIDAESEYVETKKEVIDQGVIEDDVKAIEQEPLTKGDEANSALEEANEFFYNDVMFKIDLAESISEVEGIGLSIAQKSNLLQPIKLSKIRDAYAKKVNLLKGE